MVPIVVASGFLINISAKYGWILAQYGLFWSLNSIFEYKIFIQEHYTFEYLHAVFAIRDTLYSLNSQKNKGQQVKMTSVSEKYKGQFIYRQVRDIV